MIEMSNDDKIRLNEVLRILDISASSWYYKPREQSADRRRGNHRPMPDEVIWAVVIMAYYNPWYGYKRIAVMCRRAAYAGLNRVDVAPLADIVGGPPVSDRQAYRVMRDYDLLQKKRTNKAAVYQASKLYELLPMGPNELWQMDVTYINIPGYGWYYAITVIDYYSRYLLGCRLTASYAAAEAIEALKEARAEAESIHGPLEKEPFLVTDNGSSFIAKRFTKFIEDDYCHVRIQYRTPTQLGLLERFHKTLKEEEVYWRLYDNPNHARGCLAEFRVRYNNLRPHWALIPEEGGDPMVPAEVYVQGKRTQLPKWQPWARKVKKKLEGLLQAEEAA